jgi:hypothetical protein
MSGCRCRRVLIHRKNWRERPRALIADFPRLPLDLVVRGIKFVDNKDSIVGCVARTNNERH